MSNLARLEHEFHEETAVARLEGEIDASNVEDIGEQVRALVSNRSFALVVDLSGIAYMDSAGINLLFALGEEMRSRQQRLAIVVREGSPIARIVSMTGLDRAVSTHATLEEALAA